MFHEINLNSLTVNTNNCSLSKINKRRIQKDKRLYALDNLQYIYAHLCIIDVGNVLNSMNKESTITSLTSVELCFTIRHAIDTTIKDLFGEFSGLPILYYDLLFCHPQNNVNTSKKNHNHYQQQLTNTTNIITWSILLAVPYNNMEKMIGALSFMTNDLGGSVLINKLCESVNLSSNDSLKFYVDVISISDSLFNLPCVPIYKL
ncbi:hypothetical protein MN116_003025 [Schistosoma mekongi]|uniref:Uncharacterized protein n=1 Tax=Schistosoma mekongi TaxID=38744 RepID=A0AAE1ZG86_SCHME|nr:hypothetical protein MN116_003025 [Schistosoma mekongi]